MHGRVLLLPFFCVNFFVCFGSGKQFPCRTYGIIVKIREGEAERVRLPLSDLKEV